MSYANERDCITRWGCEICGGCGEFWYECDCNEGNDMRRTFQEKVLDLVDFKPGPFDFTINGIQVKGEVKGDPTGARAIVQEVIFSQEVVEKMLRDHVIKLLTPGINNDDIVGVMHNGYGDYWDASLDGMSFTVTMKQPVTS